MKEKKKSVVSNYTLHNNICDFCGGSGNKAANRFLVYDRDLSMQSCTNQTCLDKMEAMKDNYFEWMDKNHPSCCFLGECGSCHQVTELCGRCGAMKEWTCRNCGKAFNVKLTEGWHYDG